MNRRSTRSQFGKLLHRFFYEGYFQAVVLTGLAYLVVVILLVAGGK